MGNPISNFFAHASNIFNRDKKPSMGETGGSSSDNGRTDNLHYGYGGERTIIQAIYTRMAVDSASYRMRHVIVDDNDDVVEFKDSSINDLFNFSANIDQTGRAFIQNAVSSMFNEGIIAIVPIDTDISPEEANNYKIESARIGRIQTWYPTAVDVEVYNDRLGFRQVVHIDKRNVCIVQNPFYSIMNQPNSTVKRLVSKMNLLDVIDKQSGSGKLDIIIQLPYTTRTEARRTQAEERKQKIEDQMSNSKYGVAYIDATEKITQLNRPAENNLMLQIEYLTRMLYSQLGITEEILDGTADEEVMLNYFNRLIEPPLAAICAEVERTWFTKNARSRKHRMRIIKDPLRFVKASSIGEMIEALGRNEIFSSDEVRIMFGRLPRGTERSDALLNKQIGDNAEATTESEEVVDKEEPDGKEEV